MAKEEEKEKPEIKQNIIPASITTEMEKAYLDYAMSVIVARALPDVRDGLKPVHRRIIYAMKEQGMTPGARYQKSAAVVGEVLKKYHPHGDAALYEALVRMAQTFSMRYLLVDGQGNFGSVDGDSAAAMRYTECRLATLSDELLKDIEKETVDFVDNYSATDYEPSVLPATVPNLLLNGTSGIAVGLATNIATHNLAEVVDATLNLIDQGKVEIKETKTMVVPSDYPFRYKRPEYFSVNFQSQAGVEDLLEFIKGPDFPTGGTIYDWREIVNAYATGKGSIPIRAKAKIEEDKNGRFAIIVSELPYQVNKSLLVAKIAELAREKKIEGIADLRDESDRTGIRVVIELKKDARPQQILNNLYKHTEMQRAFHVNTVALVHGEPRLLTLKNILEEFVRHRLEIVTRRTLFLLKKSREREHILQGLKIALDHLDEVIKTIRASQDADAAKENLVRKFDFTSVQAQAILDMQLRRLAALERLKVDEELKETVKMIKGYEALLAEPKLILGEIKKELNAAKEKHGDERKTKVVKGTVGEMSDEDLIKEEEVFISLTQSGYIKRLPLNTYRTQGRGGRGVAGSNLKEGDVIAEMHAVSTHDELLFFTTRGRVYRQRAWDVPEASRTAKGTAVVNILDLMPEEKVAAIVPLSKDPGSGKGSGIQSLFMATVNGTVKKTLLSDFDNIRKSGIIALRLETGDSLAWVKPTSGKDQIMLVSQNGKAIRFKENQIREMGRSAAGVRGIRLGKGDQLVCLDIIPEGENKGRELLVVGQKGFGKRTKLSQYRLQGRGGAGIMTSRVTKKTGPIVHAQVVDASAKDLVITSTQGQVIRMETKKISVVGRATQGVRVMRLEAGDSVAAATVLSEESPTSA